MRIGIIDIVSHKSDLGWFTKLMNPKLSSIMPQVIGVWLEELGHDVWYYICGGYENLQIDLNTDLDVVFISCYTASAYSAYSLSQYYQSQGIITILGGPHSRSYPNDSNQYFDYVIELLDKKLLIELVENISYKNGPRNNITSKEHPTQFAPMQKRWKYIQYAHKKTGWYPHYLVAMIGSTGCPYSCEFCIDCNTPYKMLNFDMLQEDLKFLQKQDKSTVVMWYDPNFGIKFDKYMELIESTDTSKLKFGIETSLSTLTEEHCKILAKNKFIAVAPGIESWSGYNHKTNNKSYISKLNKVKETSNHLNMVSNYIPIIQANMLFGLDCDEGKEPFELTKKFIDATPSTYVNFQTLSVFGTSAPIWKKYNEEGRLLKIPLNQIDAFSTSNIKFNYNLIDFYTWYAELIEHASSIRVTWNKIKYTKLRFGKIFNLVRRFTGRGNAQYYRDFVEKLKTTEYQEFYSGKTLKPPTDYHNQVKEELGFFYRYLPQKIINYLNTGESDE